MKRKFLSYSKNLILKLDWHIVLISLLSLVSCQYFMPHKLWIMNDIGRELLFPQLILDNSILYKDIFNLFGPFSYLFNALIYKFFGSGLNIIYGLGYITSLFMILGIYLVSNELLSKNSSFLISLFSIAVGITTVQNFNYCIPYSYGFLYGSIAFLGSLYFFIKYIKTKDVGFIYFSSLLCGIAIANKYEFILYSVFFLFYSILKFPDIKRIKHVFVLCFLFFLPSIICYIYLILQGLTYSEIINSIILIKNIILTSGYKYMYSGTGTYFSLNNLRYCIIAALKIIAFLVPFYFADKFYNIGKKTIGCGLYILAAGLLLYCSLSYSYNNILCFLPILVLLLFIVRLKLKQLTSIEFYVILSVILTTLKVFWCCHIKYYGVFFIPVLVIALFILISNKAVFQKALRFFFAVYSFTIIIYNTHQIDVAGFEVYTNNFPIFTFQDSSWKINQTVKYILKNTNKCDKVVIYPEGQLINYLTKRQTENFYYAMTPPYMELFGEKNIIKYFENNPPKYFILTNENMISYNKKRLCIDYGYKLCKFINDNYKTVKTIKYNKNDSEPYYIYKHN